MEEKIRYTTIDEQIEKLKSQHLIINDENEARSLLQIFGYSNLIKSYRNPYIIKSDGQKFYRSGVTFEQIFSLFLLDKNLRNAVMAAMQDLEEHIKETTANVIARAFGVKQNDYLLYHNYNNKRKRKERFSLPGILDTMKAALDTDKEPIRHYVTDYGIVPPWILFKSIYFSTITNYIDLFKPSEQFKMVEYLYDSEYLELPPEALCKLMMDTLFICIDYRNIAAHGGRVYNYRSDKRLRTEEIFGEKTIPNIDGFSKLLFLLNLLKYENPYTRLSSTLEQEITRHCSVFPEDVTYLGQILNVNISRHRIVWVSKNSNKYHLLSHCSGLHDTTKLFIEEATSQGYIPCKRCCK